MTTTPPVPEGFMRNASGHLVPTEMVRPIDRMRDQVVNEMVLQALDVSAIIARFKRMAFADIAAFCQLSAEQYKVKTGGDKGNVTLISYDGRYKIVRQVQETMRFDERLQTAKVLIDECLTEWGDKAPPELKVIVMDTFRVNKENAVQTDRVLSLRRHDIKHEKWMRAMDAIAEGLQVVGSRHYVRFYERVGDTDSYKAISLDLASA